MVIQSMGCIIVSVSTYCQWGSSWAEKAVGKAASKIIFNNFSVGLLNTMKKCLDAKNDDMLFKKEKSNLSTDLETTERPADLRKPCTHEELNNSIRDCMVRKIVASEQGEEEDESNDEQDEEEDENNSDKDDGDEDVPNDVGQKFVQVLLLDSGGGDSHVYNINKIYNAMVSMKMKDREKGSVSQSFLLPFVSCVL